jgi:coenzyme F420-reducing hydrogenase beta subunit
MIENKGCYEPSFHSPPTADATQAWEYCPFGGLSDAEDRIANAAFSGDGFKTSPKLGRYLNLYAGWAASEELRLKASSGAIGRWILAELLERKLVDAVVQVAKVDGLGGPHYKYQVFEDSKAVYEAGKSAYYPVEVSGILREIRSSKQRVAITALPCFAKTLKALSLSDPELQGKIKYVIGLFCGHLKSKWYAEMAAWGANADPSKMLGIDFRGKSPTKSAAAKEYRVTEQGLKGQVVERKAFESDLFGTNWGQGFLKYSACDFCDDVAAENADLTVGDVWLPQYTSDWRGTSLVVVRSHELDQLLRDGSQAGVLRLETLSEYQVVQSQDAGFRHRRQGLSVRLGVMEEKSQWAPPKRTSPKRLPANSWNRRLFALRQKITHESFAAYAKAKQAGSLEVFVAQMKPLVEKYSRLYREKSPLERLGARLMLQLRRVRLFADYQLRKRL